MLEPPRIMLELPRIMVKAPRIMLEPPRIMLEPPRIMVKAPSIKLEPPNKMSFDQLRQLWLSIVCIPNRVHLDILTSEDGLKHGYQQSCAYM